MSLLFGDIYEAIRAERIKKGVNEKDILNVVQEKAGGSMSVANVLKTIKTLKKLVEDGVLIKKGKRYMFNTAPKCENNEDEDEDIDDDEDEDDDDDGEDDICNNKEEPECPDEDEGEGEDEDADEDEDEEGGEGEDNNNEEVSPCCANDDEDDDDDDDEDDDDDDDDQDDDACGDDACGDDGCGDKDTSSPKEPPHGKNGSEKKEVLREKSGVQCKSAEKMILNAGKENSAENNNENEARKSERKCMSPESRDDKSREKNATENSVIDTNTEKKSRGGESIAFCVRDFIDSLYRPKSHSSLEEKLPKYDDTTQENMDADETNEEMGKILQERKRKFPAKRSKMSGSNYRSRSPVKKVKAKSFNLKRDRSEAFRCRTTSSQYYHEPMDADVDVNIEMDKDIEIEYESPTDRNPLGCLPATASRAEVLQMRTSTFSVKDQKEPDPNFPDNKMCTAKNNTNTPMITAFEVDNVQNRTYDIEDDETSEKKYKRKAEFSDDDIINDDDKESLCSVCEKTIKNP